MTIDTVLPSERLAANASVSGVDLNSVIFSGDSAIIVDAFYQAEEQTGEMT